MMAGDEQTNPERPGEARETPRDRAQWDVFGTLLLTAVAAYTGFLMVDWAWVYPENPLARALVRLFGMPVCAAVVIESINYGMRLIKPLGPFVGHAYPMVAGMLGNVWYINSKMLEEIRVSPNKVEVLSIAIFAYGFLIVCVLAVAIVGATLMSRYCALDCCCCAMDEQEIKKSR